MNKLKMLIGMISIILSVSVFFGCSSTKDLKAEKVQVEKASTAKEQFILDLNKAFAGVKPGEKPKLTPEQQDMLVKSSIKMLKEEGVYDAECQKIEKENKAGLILIATLYVAATKNLENSMGKYLK